MCLLYVFVIRQYVFKLIPLLCTHVYSYMFRTVHPPRPWVLWSSPLPPLPTLAMATQPPFSLHKAYIINLLCGPMGGCWRGRGLASFIRLASAMNDHKDCHGLLIISSSKTMPWVL